MLKFELSATRAIRTSIIPCVRRLCISQRRYSVLKDQGKNDLASEKHETKTEPLKDQKQEQQGNSDYQGEEKKISPHSVFYRQFSKPFIKVCALSIGTYYGLIGLWELLDDGEESVVEAVAK
ncbi:uncharacterized protein RJT20DRAFT_37253 [Scheffersomyces xylosifermentans]|uniref:uncharacterized protein n=1 Tax=Scheffersomyces xylosifermentans TaxID=1304137 RepID=UPI00315C7F76